jgi:hypothetical protein
MEQLFFLAVKHRFTLLSQEIYASEML